MSDRIDRHEPRTDDGRRRRILTAEQRAIVDEVNQELSEIRASFEDHQQSTDNKVRAMRETLENQDVQAALDRIATLEEGLNRIPLDGDEDILARLGDAEVALQRMSCDQPEGATGPSMRDQSIEVFAEEIARNPVWAQLIRNDPALTVEYQEALSTYMTRGKDVVLGSKRRRDIAARANSYGERVWNDPQAVRAAGGVTDQVMNTLTTDFDPGFGMRVPIPIATRIVRRAFEFSPLLTDSGQATTTSKVYPYLKDTGWDPSIHVRGEREDVIENDDNDELFEEDQINIEEENVTTRMTLVMIEDGIDVVQEYELRTARVLGKKASWKVHNGSGTKMPLGLLKDPKVIKVMSGSADSLPFTSLLNAQLDLDPEYESGARYYMSKGATKAAVLATNAVGQFIWQPSQVDGTPSLLHGYPWRRDSYLVNESSVTDTGVFFATGAHPVLFGNVGVGCLNVQRLGLQVQIDDLTKKGWRKFWSRRRWGWGVVDPAALRLIEIGVGV